MVMDLANGSGTIARIPREAFSRQRPWTRHPGDPERGLMTSITEG